MGAGGGPVTGIIGAGASFAGTGLEVTGLKEAAASARQRGDYQAAILRNNAVLSRAAADAIRDRGRIQVSRKQTAISQMIGSQRVALAASGILVDEGSAVDVIADTAFVGEQELNDIRTNAERAALAQEIEAMNFEQDANLAHLVGFQQERAIKQKIPGTILAGTAKGAQSAASGFGL